MRITDWKIIPAIPSIILIGWTIFVILQSPLDAPKEVNIKDGQGVYEIADILKNAGVINNKFVFVFYVLATGNEAKLQAGTYVFEPGSTIITVAYTITKGLSESNDIVLTIPEGFNVFDIDKRLASLNLIKKGGFAVKYFSEEGKFFPDTYRISLTSELRITPNQSTGADATGQANYELWLEEISRKMLNNFKNKTDNLLTNLNDREINSITILASILEKEAKSRDDMRLVAGGVKNRLEKGIPLQIDATVAYGACLRKMNYELGIMNNESGNPETIIRDSKFVIPYQYCDVSQIGVADEIKIDGPYNTYTRAGLPPGPMANTGLTAIEAALNPAETDYLYYLSTRDGSQIIFSKTSAEHA